MIYVQYVTDAQTRMCVCRHVQISCGMCERLNRRHASVYTAIILETYPLHFAVVFKYDINIYI